MKNIFKLSIVAIAISLAAFKLIDPEKVNIIFIGDSITYGSNQPNLQPSVYALGYLKRKLPATKFSQANRGVPGYTTLNFLPGQADFDKVVKDADGFYADNSAQLLFSVMLGTNDSAMKGTLGAPVSATQYAANLKTIADSLLKRYPNSRIVLNAPIYYSPNTYNGAMYLQEGLNRLQSYLPEIVTLVKNYNSTNPNHVFIGYTNGIDDFRKDYQFALQPENGKQGVFYLHPNAMGAKYLGMKWADAIYSALKN